ncbi:uncharacterized protein RHOBADRAFT_56545 [Rhodotorula graminis WP1]|uniref:DNA repair metallo-beta-lactamase domain-containing protein n=1 Tax=Rhodotorula graminis (strain WP1) TaxID=578459 RepID=A0A0P9GFA5_RHOGW|nr:uncharacterized protein RHOBADRAFT_56545 [Rhodotorula graminis WP1]KPV71502.1 hypothetical protein RHOBADRAFT_56545 [Rhodotorula graminis WP1]
MSTHHGFIKEFPFIRVDAFNGDPAALNPFTPKAPHFYLLTHAHTDHIAGLNSPHFHGQIYATPITKQLVLDTIEAADRVRYEELGHRVGRRFKFANLRKVKARRPSSTAGGASVRAGRQGTGIDRIKEIPLNTRFEVEGPDGVVVTITALDANHCPGSCMFLIEGVVAGTHRAVLITGDVRIEPWWLDALRHNPLVEPYLPPPHAQPGSRPRTVQAHVEGPSSGTSAKAHRGRARALDCVYLDTSNVLLDEELVTKDQAVAAAVDLMAQYPPETRFFLNTWTWGYEELLKGVHRAFGDEIHLDWYKHRMYTSAPFRAADPLLAALGTTASFPSSTSPTSSSPASARLAVGLSPSLHFRAGVAAPSASTATSASRSTTSSSSSSTRTCTTSTRSSVPPPPPPRRPLRFHACERRWKCDHVWQDGLGSYSFEAAHVPLLGGPKRLKRPGSGERLPEDEGEGEGGRVGQRGVAGRAPRVVYVNPSEMPRWRWDAYRDEVQGRIDAWKARDGHGQGRERDGGRQGRDDESGKGKKRARGEGGSEAELPEALIVPLARHSSLPELQSLVALFRPRTLYPLTCTDDDPVAPAHQYLSLPSLFGALLAPGGEVQLRDEAEQYRRRVLAQQRARGGRTSRIVEPSEETPPQDEGGDLIEPAWVTEMSRKGLNIEGGEDVLDEVVAWAQRLAKGERAPSASASPRARKRAKPASEDERPSVDVLELGDSADEADGDADTVVEPVAPASRDRHRPSSSTSSSARQKRTHPVPLDAVSSSSTLTPYPPGDMPSPFLAAVAERHTHTSARDVTPEPALAAPRPASTSLRLATSAKPPPPRKSVTFSSPTRGGRGDKPTYPPATAPGAAAMLPPARPPALLPPFDSSTSTSTFGPTLPRPSTSSSTSSTVTAPLAVDPVPRSRAAQTPSSRPSASTTTTRVRPALSTRAKRQAVVACLQRQMRGVIAPQGGRIEPFAPGDPRLQGRKALKGAAALEPGSAPGSEQTSRASEALEAVKENVRGLGADEGKERVWDSPTSFRTVSVTASP